MLGPLDGAIVGKTDGRDDGLRVTTKQGQRENFVSFEQLQTEAR